VPIFAGTGEAALTLGAGHLTETGAPDGEGNIAIAGHRDGFFRALRHLEVGDRLVLTGDAGARTFEISETHVVAPEDVWVLDPTDETVLTLITCYPFYFVGSAPDRYVVRARLLPAQAAADNKPLNPKKTTG
jgi:sortase A